MTILCQSHLRLWDPYSLGWIKQKNCTQAKLEINSETKTTGTVSCEELFVYPNNYKLANNVVKTSSVRYNWWKPQTMFVYISPTDLLMSTPDTLIKSFVNWKFVIKINVSLN